MFLRGKKVRKRVAWRVHIRTQIQSLFVKERLVATRKFYIYVNNHYQSWL